MDNDSNAVRQNRPQHYQQNPSGQNPQHVPQYQAAPPPQYQAAPSLPPQPIPQQPPQHYQAPQYQPAPPPQPQPPRAPYAPPAPVIQDIPRTAPLPPLPSYVPNKTPDVQYPKPVPPQPQAAAPTSAAQPHSAAPATAQKQNKAGNVVDYEIHGVEMQYVEIMLPPGEAVVGEIEDMFYYEQGIRMKGQLVEADQKKGLWARLMGMGKSVLTGERLFVVTFNNVEKERQKVAFMAPAPGMIVPIDLNQYGGMVFCETDAFVCAMKGVRVSQATLRDLGGGILGPGFSMQKLFGKGVAFIHCGGTLLPRILAKGEIINASLGAIAAFQPGVEVKVRTVRNAKGGGENHSVFQITGPGTVWLQSMPYHRMREDMSKHMLTKLSALGFKIKKPLWKK